MSYHIFPCVLYDVWASSFQISTTFEPNLSPQFLPKTPFDTPIQIEFEAKLQWSVETWALLDCYWPPVAMFGMDFCF